MEYGVLDFSIGDLLMPRWCADNWDFLKLVRFSLKLLNVVTNDR